MYETGRYQSRLFIWLNRRYRGLVKTGDRAVRQLKVTVEWTAQVLLYPAYLLLQTTRLAFRQFKQAVKPGSHPLPNAKARSTPASCDAPIQQVLLDRQTIVASDSEALPSLPRQLDAIVNSAPIATETPSSISKFSNSDIGSNEKNSPSVIRGIATLLTTRNLVLVTADNQIIDSLTPQQQKKLRQSIDGEMADYYWRQRQLLATPPPAGSLQQIASRDRVIPPFRQFWQVMAWVESGTVAIAIDLFRESRLAVRPSLSTSISDRKFPLAEPPSFLRVIDRQIARIESGQIELGGTKFNIYTLIGAAIDYFFGSGFIRKKSERKLQQATRTEPRLTSTEKRLESTVISRRLESKDRESGSVTNWLTMTDLFESRLAQSRSVVNSFGSRESLAYPSKNTVTYQTDKPNIIRSEPVNNIARVEPKLQKDSPTRTAKIALRENRSNSNKFTAQKTEVLVSDLLASPSAQKSKVSTPSSASLNPSKGWDVDPVTDWIETKATLTGYVKHPLEILLEWLDEIILWLEELVIRVWKWLLQH